MQNYKQFRCDGCGKMHDDWPSLVYSSPYHYNSLQEDQKNKAILTSDFCQIPNDEGVDQFIRVVLIQKVYDHCEDLEYGFWVSLSEKSYTDYETNYSNENHETTYFGWLCNLIPEYEDMLAIPLDVRTKRGNSRPEIFPHQDFDHPFVNDYYNGISKADAETRISAMLSTMAQNGQKPWWKIW
jgi:hypothetical protein